MNENIHKMILDRDVEISKLKDRLLAANAENERLREAFGIIKEVWNHYKDEPLLDDKIGLKPKPMCDCWPILSTVWCAIRISIKDKASDNPLNDGDLIGQLHSWPKQTEGGGG